MVPKFLKFFDRKLDGLHQAAFFLALAAIISKILALLRDRFLASAFGAGKTLDIYYASFIIPDYVYNLFLLLVSANALIPIFLEKVSQSPGEGRDFLSRVFTVFFIGTLALVGLIFFFVPYLTPFVVPGFSADETDQVSIFSRLLLLSPFLLGLSNLVSSAIQSLRKFFIYALAPVFYNIGIILGILFFYKWMGLSGIVLGVIVGAFFHFSIQLPSLIKAGFCPSFVSKINAGEIKNIIKFSFPRTLGLTLNQLVLTVITAAASFLGAGSIAVFNLAINLQTIPLTIIGMSYGIAAFPTLVRLHIGKEKEKFVENVLIACRHIIFWSFPVTVLFIVLRAQIVRTVLGAGAFTWADTRLTAASLALLSLAVAGQGLMFLLIRAYYAAGRTITPLLINFFSSFFIIAGVFSFLRVLNAENGLREFLEGILKVEGVAGAEMLILPLIFSIGTIINALLLWFYFQKDFGKIFFGLKKTVADISLASFATGAVAYVFLGFFSKVFDVRTFIGIFSQGLSAGFCGIVAGIFVLKILKNEELEEIIFFLKRRTGKLPVVAREPEKLP